MKRTRHSSSWVALLFLAACGGVIDEEVESEAPLRGFPDLVLVEPQAKDQSFLRFDNWGTSFTSNDGWRAETPILYGRINADAKDDFVGFGDAGVYVGLSGDTKLSWFQFALADFGVSSGWRVDRHVRLLGDINGDGLDDIVGFGNDGVFTALSTGGFFGPVRYVLADGGYNQGWRVEKHTRILADVNGDKRKDIVAFGDAGVYFALADGSGGFGPFTYAIADLGATKGWTPAKHVRTTADLNGDGREDIVAIGDAGVWTALSTGNGFAAPRYVLAAFGANQGWTSANTRVLADVNADGRKDLVGISSAGVTVARSLGNGTFGAASVSLTSIKEGVVADLNGDGFADILSYYNGWWKRALGGPSGFGAPRDVLQRGVYPGWWSTADVDGNGMVDLVLNKPDGLQVARSTDQPPPPPPPAPSNLTLSEPVSTGFTLRWVDNSTDENVFEIQPVGVGPFTVPANTTEVQTWKRIPLKASTRYCFRIRAKSDLANSAWSNEVCGTTAQGPVSEPPVLTWTMSLQQDPNWDPNGHIVTWTGFWTPQGRTIVQFRSGETSSLGATILFIKPGHSSKDCYVGSPHVVALPPLGKLAKADVDQISWNAGTSIGFHACRVPGPTSGNTIPSVIFFNLDYRQ